MIRRRPVTRSTLCAVLALAWAGLAIPGCSEQERVHGSGGADAVPIFEGGVKHAKGAGSRLQVDLAGMAKLDRPSHAGLAAAARRFALTFAEWLYGDRRQVPVEPIAEQLRAELVNAPPYVPPEQLGSREGEVVRVQVFLQTTRSGLLVVWIRDSRTTYWVPAHFERGVGHWEVVHLNTH